MRYNCQGDSQLGLGLEVGAVEFHLWLDLEVPRRECEQRCCNSGHSVAGVEEWSCLSFLKEKGTVPGVL